MELFNEDDVQYARERESEKEDADDYPKCEKSFDSPHSDAEVTLKGLIEEGKRHSNKMYPNQIR